MSNVLHLPACLLGSLCVQRAVEQVQFALQVRATRAFSVERRLEPAVQQQGIASRAGGADDSATSHHHLRLKFHPPTPTVRLVISDGSERQVVVAECFVPDDTFVPHLH